MSEAASLIGIIMGSQSDWETMQHAAETLDRLGIGYEARIASAHRTPDRVQRYAGAAQARGVKVIIAAAGGAAVLFWLDDRSPDFVDTQAFIERRLADLHRLTGLRQRLASAADSLPNPFRLVRRAR